MRNSALIIFEESQKFSVNFSNGGHDKSGVGLPEEARLAGFGSWGSKTSTRLSSYGTVEMPNLHFQNRKFLPEARVYVSDELVDLKMPIIFWPPRRS